MPVEQPDLDIDLSSLSSADWYAALDEIGEEHGYLERLGSRHSALFIDAGPDLLVTFETEESVRKRPRGVPRGFEMVTRRGYSLLSIIANGETWFRDWRLFGYFDRLTDDGFFEDFDKTLFYGNHMGAYGAAAFSVVSPGARALLLRPVATLNPDMTGWDQRYVHQRGLDFTTRYGYGPDMIDAAAHAYVMNDPHHRNDAMHAALFRKLNVTILKAPYAGARIEQLCDMMQITPHMLETAMSGALDRTSFAKLWRARRDNLPYVRTLLKRLEAANRPALMTRLCRYGLTTRDRALYEQMLDQLASQKHGGEAAE